MRVLIVGCGYVGVALGKLLLTQGHEVFGLRRGGNPDTDLTEAGISPLHADISNLEDLQKLPANWDYVVNLVSSDKGGEEEYRSVYLQGNRNLIAWLTPAPPKKFVYTSSTSVYGQIDGSQVKETSPTTPPSATSKILLEAEQVLLEAFAQTKFPTVILRVAGIYGPDRGHLFQKFIKGEAKIAGKGDRIINMIHLEDVAGAIVAAFKSGRPGEIYNVVDDEPVAEIHFYRWLSETVGKYMPPFTTEAEAADRKRGLTNKKVQNRRLKMEMGYALKYPTYRQGYTAEIKRLDDAGLLNVAPDDR